jgi:hypothetical protein
MKLNLLQCLLSCTILLQSSLLIKADPPPTTVYVRDFMTRDRDTTDITRSLTEEFEVALKNSQAYDILDRRDLDLLDSEKDKEKTAMSSTDIPENAAADLKRKGAQMVIFGEVFDDIGSGQVSVTVTFEDWNSEKQLIKEIDIPRGTINDKPTREAAMAELVKKIVQGNQPVLKAETHSFLVEITKCQGQGENVTVEMQVTDNDDLDRNFGLKIRGNGTCLLFDNNGNQAAATYARVSNQEGNAGIVRSLLVSGIPVKCTLEFGGVPEHATALSRLFINMVGGDENFNMTFKNIPIER